MKHQPNFTKQIFHNSRRFLAKNWLSLQPATQIAITGSQGKTATTQLIAKILPMIGKTVVTDINLDTIYNVPITALKVAPWIKFAVFELGVDKPGEMDYHLEIVKPKIAVVTGISPVHTDREHLGSLENLVREKRKLIEALPKDGYAILNWDDENVRKMASYTNAKVQWYGTNKKYCHVWANNWEVSLQGTKFDLHDEEKVLKVNTQLIGKNHIYNIMAAYLVYKIVRNAVSPTNLPARHDLDEDKFVKTIKNITPLSGRMSLEKGPLGTIIINDSLRANPTSTVFGLQTLSEIDYQIGRKIAVLAEMGELEKPEEEHRKIGQLISQLKVDYLISIGPMQKYTADNAVKNGINREHVFWAKNVHEAASILKKIVKKNDLLYLKGSLLRHVERVLLILQGNKVSCQAITCPFYAPCSNCRFLEKNYPSF